MKRAPFSLVDSLGRKTRLSDVAKHDQRKGADCGVRRIGCQWQEPDGLCSQ
jgi:hypothetical protein